MVSDTEVDAAFQHALIASWAGGIAETLPVCRVRFNWHPKLDARSPEGLVHASGTAVDDRDPLAVMGVQPAQDRQSEFGTMTARRGQVRLKGVGFQTCLQVCPIGFEPITFGSGGKHTASA